MDIVLNKELKKEDNLFFKKIKTKSEIVEDCDGFLIDSDESEIRRILDVLKAKKIKKIIAVSAKDEEFNRRALETMKINFLVSPEYDPNKDSLKQRASGINHVLAKISAKNKIPIIIDFSRFNKIDDKKGKATILARIIQNIKISRRAGSSLKIATLSENPNELRSERELKSFLFSLGASSQQVRDSCGF
jgi:RNase P/RNase MRP subunit p30